MRSAVSSMLSEPSDFNPQVFPDYTITAWNHRQALVAVTPIGTSVTGEDGRGSVGEGDVTLFRQVLDVVKKVDHVTPVSIAGQQQASSNGGSGHSNQPNPTPSNFRVRYVTEYPVENNEWGEFQRHRQLLGLVSVGGFTTHQELEELKRLHRTNVAKYKTGVLDSRLIALNLANKPKDASDNKFEDERDDTSSVSSGGVGNTLVYDLVGGEWESCLASDVADFCTAIFWILESKRVEELQKEGKQDKLAFLSAPFEKKDFVGLDLDSRSNKKRIFGRYRKSLGDLSLLCDRMLEAFKHYEVAAEILRSCNDWLWLASATEGLCAISTIAQFPDPNTGRFESVRTLHESVDVLKPSDVVERYKEIVGHYAKYRQAGMIETEVSVKAVAVLTELENHLTAAEFLQNMVFINLNMNDREKVRRFSALSKLYSGIGFHRKAAFFLRVAAMRCVGPNNPHPDWPLCYSMLMDANYGYSKFQQKDKSSAEAKGWPALQVQLMLELVGTSRKMNRQEAAVIHVTRLLDLMFNHLTPNQLDDICKQLSGIVGQLRSPEIKAHRHLAHLSGREYLMAYTGLKRVPEVSSFKVVALPSYLAPKASKRASSGASGPFLFKSFGGGGALGESQDGKVPFDWVVNDMAEVQLELSNPLPVEVKVVNLVLITEGAQFESFPSTFSLGVSKEKITVSLMGVPRESGLVKFTGYSCSVFGLPSTCSLDKLASVNVIPRLPLLQGTILKGGQSDCTEEVEGVYVMTGEKTCMKFLLTNVSNPSEADGVLESDGVQGVSGNVVRIQDVNWTSNPPLPPNTLSMGWPSKDPDTNSIEEKKSVEILLEIVGTPPQPESLNPSTGVTSGHTSKSSSLDNRRQFRGIEDEFNSISLHDEADVEPGSSYCQDNVYHLEFKVSYSSKSSDTQGATSHYRELVRKLKLVVSPSAHVTRWDVMPSETYNRSYLVLDIENRTENEMEIAYGGDTADETSIDKEAQQAKCLAMEPGDQCRIPLSINCFIISGSNQATRAQHCFQYLRQRVNVRWRRIGDEDGGGGDATEEIGSQEVATSRSHKEGRVMLDHLQITDEMVRNLEQLPIKWEVTANGKGLGREDKSEGPVATVTPGSPIDLNLTLASGFEFSLEAQFEVAVKVAGIQDFASIDDVCIQSQRRSMKMNCDARGGTASFKSMVLPLVPGKFEVECLCHIHSEGRNILSKFPKFSVLCK